MYVQIIRYSYMTHTVTYACNLLLHRCILHLMRVRPSSAIFPVWSLINKPVYWIQTLIGRQIYVLLLQSQPWQSHRSWKSPISSETPCYITVLHMYANEEDYPKGGSGLLFYFLQWRFGANQWLSIAVSLISLPPSLSLVRDKSLSST